MENLLELCERAVEVALRSGADEAEAMCVRRRGVDVELQKNDIQIAKSARANGLGIRVFRKRSLGFAYVNSFDEDSITDSVERALGIAHGSPEDPHNGLPDPTPIAKIEGLFDESSAEFDVSAAVERALTMLHTARDYDLRVTVDGGELAGGVAEKAIWSSRGVRASETTSLFYCYLLGMAKEGNSVSSMDFQFDGARSAAAIDPRAIARKLAENVIGSLGAVKGESFRGTVILAPKAATEIVLGPISTSVSASAVQKETSRFRGKLGTKVASELLTVTDDATFKDGFSTTSFDREGIAPEVLPLIKDGILTGFLYDSYTGRKDGRAGNGHAGGGASEVPSVSTTNVVVSSGESSLEQMIAGVERGVLVTRFSGNTDAVSGDFSGSVKGGRMIRGGRLAEPLCGTMIAGNVFDLLPEMVALSRERERVFSCVVPHMQFAEVAITGG
ncbi:MAG: TldD/PmbA family protein [Candidatus Eisenbacteria bacterium]|nr:TldD/PmbA family protein [Candidatus Eisenbacteria bacterium]